MFKEELFEREGLCTHPYLFCPSFQTKTAIPFAWSGSRSLAETGKVIHHTVLSKQCSAGAKSGKMKTNLKLSIGHGKKIMFALSISW